jgi:N-acetyl-beta-hexosaminidase
VLGIEAPLWSETVTKREDFEFLAFPRLLAIAEVGWTPQASRRWEDFSLRLGAQGPRLQAFGINFHRSPEVPWMWQEGMWTREPAARAQPQLPVP